MDTVLIPAAAIPDMLSEALAYRNFHRIYGNRDDAAKWSTGIDALLDHLIEQRPDLKWNPPTG
ncbi:MAG: hypothetical protein E6Q97_25250 [Desulfurellales bacterium]|nr:MAG: hypothetical protein E6Q97_25250 [Desulfurellales bacterium]